MGSENRTKSFAIALGVIALSAVLAFLGVGLHPIWWLTWFALVPLLWFAARASAWMSFAVAAIAWIAGSLGWWHYLYRVIGQQVAIQQHAALVALAGAAAAFIAYVLWPRWPGPPGTTMTSGPGRSACNISTSDARRSRTARWLM
jgi:hypothetical protein